MMLVPDVTKMEFLALILASIMAASRLIRFPGPGPRLLALPTLPTPRLLTNHRPALGQLSALHQSQLTCPTLLCPGWLGCAAAGRRWSPCPWWG